MFLFRISLLFDPLTRLNIASRTLASPGQGVVVLTVKMVCASTPFSSGQVSGYINLAETSHLVF